MLYFGVIVVLLLAYSVTWVLAQSSGETYYACVHVNDGEIYMLTSPGDTCRNIFEEQQVENGGQ